VEGNRFDLLDGSGDTSAADSVFVLCENDELSERIFDYRVFLEHICGLR
jgi:hypothetical protein